MNDNWFTISLKYTPLAKSVLIPLGLTAAATGTAV